MKRSEKYCPKYHLQLIRTTNIYRISHIIMAEYNFFSVREKTDHIIKKKETLDKCIKVELSLCILYEYSGDR